MSIQKSIVDGCIIVVSDDHTYTAMIDDEENALYAKLMYAEDQELLDLISNPGLMNCLRRTGEVPTYPIFAHGHQVHYIPCDRRGKQDKQRVYIGQKLMESPLQICASMAEAERSMYYNGTVLVCCPECHKVYQAVMEDSTKTFIDEQIFNF